MGKQEIPRFTADDSADRRHDARRVMAPAPGKAFPDMPTDPVEIEISEHGCRIEGYEGPAGVGAPVTLRLPGQPAMTAWVRWARGTQIGLEFARALPECAAAAIGRLPCAPVILS